MYRAGLKAVNDSQLKGPHVVCTFGNQLAPLVCPRGCDLQSLYIGRLKITYPAVFDLLALPKGDK